MAITKTAKRQIRVSRTKRIYNDRRRKSLKMSIKTLRNSVKENSQDVQKILFITYKELDKAAKRGVIKKGQADRKKSRLSKLVAKVSK